MSPPSSYKCNICGLGMIETPDMGGTIRLICPVHSTRGKPVEEQVNEQHNLTSWMPAWNL